MNSPNIEDYLSKARESLEAAEMLLNANHPEFAVSRAYYAMFYVAEGLLYTKGLSFASHSAVAAAFGKEFAKTGLLDRKLHRYLIDAQDERTQGDYRIGSSITVERANEVIGWAADFLTAAQAYLAR
jgi:uncharacterized protein (UPF0332 family)